MADNFRAREVIYYVVRYVGNSPRALHSKAKLQSAQTSQEHWHKLGHSSHFLILFQTKTSRNEREVIKFLFSFL